MSAVYLRDIVQIVRGSVSPQNEPEETFGLISFASHDAGTVVEPTSGAAIQSNKTPVKGGDVLFAKLNPRIPRVCVVPEANGHPTICSTEFVPLRARTKDKVDPEYLRWMMLAPQFRDPILGAVSSSTKSHQRIRPKLLLEQEIPLPPLDEQRRLVARIRACLDRVEAVRQLREESTEAAGAMFKALVRERYRELLAASSRPLGELVDVQSGKTPSKQNEGYWGGDVPWISPKDMKVLELSDAQDHVTERALQERAATLIEPPVVLVVVRGMILAHTLPVAITRAPLTINQDIKALTTSGDLLPDFLAFMLMGAAPDLLDAVNTAGHGTKRLTTETLLATPIPVPTLDVQERVARSLFGAAEASRQLLQHQRAQAEQEAQLTQSILARAFAGEL